MKKGGWDLRTRKTRRDRGLSGEAGELVHLGRLVEAGHFEVRSADEGVERTELGVVLRRRGCLAER